MTELFIIQQLAKWLDERKYPFQVCNAFIYLWESDYWAMTKDGETREFEIKISKQDFLKDAKKNKHNCCDKGANFFYYVVPRGMIDKFDVNEKYGLIYVHRSGFMEVVKKPKRLNSNIFDQWKMLASKMYWRWRDAWKELYIQDKITHDEFTTGFNLKLEEDPQS